MAYDPADLRLPAWLLRLLDASIRLRIPISPKLKFGMTRPGVMLISVLTGLWLAALYSGNNLLYLCGAVLSALVLLSIWRGVTLLKNIPVLTTYLPEYTEAGELFTLREKIVLPSEMTGLIDLHFSGDTDLYLQLRLGSSPLLTGRLLAQNRGVYRLEERQLSTSAPLGLWQLSYTSRDSSLWVVLPKPVAWQGVIASDGSSGQTKAFEGDELRDLRAYMPGDPISRIHWRKAAVDSSRWTVKRFEAHRSESEEARLRVDLRLPDSATAESFEQLIGQAWYWVNHYLKNRSSSIEVVLHRQLFDLSQDEQRAAFVKALAEAVPQHSSPSGRGGVLLSLVEGGSFR